MANDTGSVYYYAEEDSCWSQQSKLVADDGSTDDYFGVCVSMYTSTALIGALLDGDRAANGGSVYVYAEADAYWSRQSKLLADDGDNMDMFGKSVSVYSMNALIGAFFDGDKSSYGGSVYYYTQTSLYWSRQAKLMSTDSAIGGGFGSAVCVYGSVALIGAFLDDDKAEDAGSVYMYTQSDSYWSGQSKILAADGGTGDMFGFYVVMQESIVLIGSAKDDEGAINAGNK
jgi:glycosyltransferase involved in cell wall biosynthesis